MLCQTEHATFTSLDRLTPTPTISTPELGYLWVHNILGGSNPGTVFHIYAHRITFVCISHTLCVSGRGKIVEQNINAHLTDLLPGQTSHQIVYLPAENLHAIASFKILLCNCYHQMMIRTTHINQMVSRRQHLQHLLSMQSHFYRVAKH